MNDLEDIKVNYSPRFEINLYKIGKEEKEIGKKKTEDYDIARFDLEEENIKNMGEIKENKIIKLTKNNKFKIKIFKLNKDGNNTEKELFNEEFELKYKENIVEVSLNDKIINQRIYEDDFDIPYKSLEFQLKFLENEYIIYSIECRDKIIKNDEINLFKKGKEDLLIAERERICPLNIYSISYSKINENKRKQNQTFPEIKARRPNKKKIEIKDNTKQLKKDIKINEEKILEKGETSGNINRRIIKKYKRKQNKKIKKNEETAIDKQIIEKEEFETSEEEILDDNNDKSDPDYVEDFESEKENSDEEDQNMTEDKKGKKKVEDSDYSISSENEEEEEDDFELKYNDYEEDLEDEEEYDYESEEYKDYEDYLKSKKQKINKTKGSTSRNKKQKIEENNCDKNSEKELNKNLIESSKTTENLRANAEEIASSPQQEHQEAEQMEIDNMPIVQPNANIEKIVSPQQAEQIAQPNDEFADLPDIEDGQINKSRHIGKTFNAPTPFNDMEIDKLFRLKNDSKDEHFLSELFDLPPDQLNKVLANVEKGI
uniref:Origin recognition complex subunit 1 n=1 Tax=Meloidogyne hapla TaxID=6305 RepID=A0A1I8BC31_MELHA